MTDALRTLLDEIRAGRVITEETAARFPGIALDDAGLEEFLRRTARETDGGPPLRDLAIVLLQCIDRRGVGTAALDDCLARLDPSDRLIVCGRMPFVRRPETVVWCHSRVASTRNGGLYHTFMREHADTVIEHCRAEMSDYLLDPQRGPNDYTVNVFEMLLVRLGVPSPFERRWLEWIDRGWFDRGGGPQSGSTLILYKILNNRWEDPAFARLVEAVRAHVRALLDADSTEEIRRGLYHLVAIVDARYRDVEFFAAAAGNVPNASVEQRAALELIRAGLAAVARHRLVPENPYLAEQVTARLYDIYHIEDASIIGYLRGPI